MGLSTFLRFDSFDAERSVTSFFVQPGVLIVTRVLSLIYLVAVLAGALATTSSLKYFIQFFTNIGWVALTLYYLVNGRPSFYQHNEPFSKYGYFYPHEVV